MWFEEGTKARRHEGTDMPLYEYICEETGETISLLRPMKDADEPVEDPDGKGRRFVRAHSTFSVGAGAPGRMSGDAFGGGCPCGNPDGPCNM
jgi:putative FmdB family regulatory protein